VSRRAFFDLLVRETVKTTAVTVSTLFSEQDKPPVTSAPVGKLPTCVPAKYQLLLSTLRRLPPQAKREWKSGLWAQFSVTEKCNGCQICAFFCPTGALTKIEQKDQVGVAFKTSLCSDCKLCQEICYRDAVRLSPTIDLNKVVNDTVDTFLMANKASMPWNVPAEERIKDIFKSTLETK
jgi:formate hydrogenlyase subunit 6/NADH:ubiquinone oxidoreductase subunit I